MQVAAIPALTVSWTTSSSSHHHHHHHHHHYGSTISHRLTRYHIKLIMVKELLMTMVVVVLI